MYWLHFIGEKYYTKEEFIKEAKEFGVSRRVAPLMLKNFSSDDTVLLAQKGLTGSRLIGAFIVKGLGGLTPGAAVDIATKMGTLVESPGICVDRGCGSYVISHWFTHSGTFSDLQAEILDRIKSDRVVGKPMLTGEFVELPRLVGTFAEVKVPDIKHRMGYRQLNFAELLKDIQTASGKKPTAKTVRLKGCFYYDKTEPQRVGEVQVQAYENYRLGSRASRLRANKLSGGAV